MVYDRSKSSDSMYQKLKRDMENYSTTLNAIHHRNTIGQLKSMTAMSSYTKLCYSESPVKRNQFNKTMNLLY